MLCKDRHIYREYTPQHVLPNPDKEEVVASPGNINMLMFLTTTWSLHIVLILPVQLLELFGDERDPSSLLP